MRTLFLLLSLFVTQTLFAATPWLKHPLRYVSADSVVTWGYDGRDFRALALSVDSSLKTKPLVLTRKQWDGRKTTFEQWNALKPQFNVMGGTGNYFTEPQTLSAAKGINQAAMLFLMQGKAEYMDYVERALYNATMHTVRDTLLPATDLDKWVAASLLFAAPGLMYATSPTHTDLYVNLYANSLTAIQLGDLHFSLDQITEMPLTGSVKFRIMGMKGSNKLKLHFRLPEWTGMRSGTPYIYIGGETLHPTLYVNGHEIDPLPVDEDGYLVVERNWRNMDEVYIDLPLQAQYVLPASTPNEKRFAPIQNHPVMQVGPVAYVPRGRTEGYYFLPKQPLTITDTFGVAGLPTLQGIMYDVKNAKQDAEAERKEFIAEPY